MALGTGIARGGLGLCLAAACLALTALADEVVVQNDSITNFSNAFIVGDFIIGEQGGARLTAPTGGGTIVGVQILWLEGTPGHPPSLENAIHIYNGNMFPTPGTELALLEGPVMTPGYWNEFRYLDEAQTIPINVPVTSGQQFYVTLEFGEDTDVGNGGPSVVRDTDGCQAGKNVLLASPGGWMNFCLFLTGDLAIRAIISRPDPTGACCFINGSCDIHTQADCTSLGGTYRGNGTNCNPNLCPAPTGACCIASTHGCLNLNQADCGTVGGMWAGAGTNCTTYVCFPSGACCLPDGSCQDNKSPDQCTALGGTFQGNLTTCGGVTCPVPQGACCLSNGNCIVFSQANCGIAGGTWKGYGTDCADNNQNGMADACEVLICRGDANCDGLIDFDDINPFVAAISGATPCRFENCDVNADNSIDFDDINPFVAAINGPGCP